MDIKPCGIEDLYYYDHNCEEDASGRIAACDTQNPSKCKFNDFTNCSDFMVMLCCVPADEVCYFAQEKNVCLETI